MSIVEYDKKNLTSYNNSTIKINHISSDEFNDMEILLKNSNTIIYKDYTYRLFDNKIYQILEISTESEKIYRFFNTSNEIIGEVDFEYLLPLGTFVKVDELNVMIIARAVITEESIYHEYLGVEYPLGVAGGNYKYFSNNEVEAIEHFGFQGLSDDIFIKEYSDFIKEKNET